MGFFDNLLGMQTNGILGTPQASPQLGISPDFIGPMQPNNTPAAPTPNSAAMAAISNPSGFDSLSANPNFSMALLKLGTSVLASRDKGLGQGQMLDNALTGFQGDIAQGAALQRQAKLDATDEALKQAHANYFNSGGASAGGGVAGAQALARMKVTGEDYATALYAVQNKLPIRKTNINGAVSTIPSPAINTDSTSSNSFDVPNPNIDISSISPDVLLHARKMIQGLAPYPTAFQTKQPFFQQALTTAEQLDPTYDFTTAPTRISVMKGFANGKQGEQIKTSNRAISHMGELLDAGDSLNNSSKEIPGVTLYNKAANAISAGSGKNATTNFNTVVNRVVPEIASAYVAGGGTGKERGMDKGDFDTGMTPQQLHGTVSETGKLLYAQVLENARQYYNNGGPYAQPKQFLTPKSLRVLKGLGVDTSEVEQLQGNQTPSNNAPNNNALPAYGTGNKPSQADKIVNNIQQQNSLSQMSAPLAIQHAKVAIAQGAPRAKVIQRLKDAGIDTSSL